MGAKNDINSGNINFKIELQKVCYFPGEYITGLLVFTPKPGITDAFFFNTESNFKIMQRQYYKYKSNDEYTAFRQCFEDIILFGSHFNFSKFLNENILLEIKIPFSIQLPFSAYPSCFYNRPLSYVSHSLNVDFPYLKVFNSIMFIVKNPQYFIKENKLLKEPCELYKKISKSKLLLNEGFFTIEIKLAKNAFFYNEVIIYDIFIDCSNLNLEINEIIIKIVKSFQNNYKMNHNKPFIKINEDVVTQRIPLDKNSKKYHYKDGIKIDKKHIPDYESIEKNGTYNLNENEKNNFFLTPSCYGGLISVGYCMNIKLIFDSLFTFNEEINIPLDFYEKSNINYIYEANNISNHSKKINNEVNINNKENNEAKNNIQLEKKDSNNSNDAPPPASEIENQNENNIKEINENNNN
jgi:hypothetical protein